MPNFDANDYIFMNQALRLAAQGLQTSMPNPRVGCVIVKDDIVVGEGAHLKVGTPHAEIHALNQAAKQANGATVYVTLEPCSHYGRTPPCAEALVQAQVAKVIVAMQDPNPIVSGQGVRHIQSVGIEVCTGLLEQQANYLNAGFVKRMSQKLPLVRSKIAASLDGKTALGNGESQWITNPAARADVQRWRARSCAILTGVGTVLKDNPSLLVRDIDLPRQPLRVIVDSDLRTPLAAKVLQDSQTLIAYANDADNKAGKLAAMGVTLLSAPNEHGKVCLKTLLSHLASIEINEVLVEGGEGVNGALMAQGMIDELVIYYAPKLMGGDAKGMFALPILANMQDTVSLDILDVRQVGVDIRLHAKLA